MSVVASILVAFTGVLLYHFFWGDIAKTTACEQEYKVERCIMVAVPESE